VKAELRGKFVTFPSYTGKEYRSEINNLSSRLRNPKEKDPIKP